MDCNTYSWSSPDSLGRAARRSRKLILVQNPDFATWLSRCFFTLFSQLRTYPVHSANHQVKKRISGRFFIAPIILPINWTGAAPGLPPAIPSPPGQVMTRVRRSRFKHGQQELPQVGDHSCQRHWVDGILAQEGLPLRCLLGISDDSPTWPNGWRRSWPKWSSASCCSRSSLAWMAAVRAR